MAKSQKAKQALEAIRELDLSAEEMGEVAGDLAIQAIGKAFSDALSNEE